MFPALVLPRTLGGELVEPAAEGIKTMSQQQPDTTGPRVALACDPAGMAGYLTRLALRRTRLGNVACHSRTGWSLVYTLARNSCFSRRLKLQLASASWAITNDYFSVAKLSEWIRMWSLEEAGRVNRREQLGNSEC